MNPFSEPRPVYGQDPHLTHHEGRYILCESRNEKKIVLSIVDPDTLRRKAWQVVWERDSEHQVWAPELHQIDGLWYIYYSSSNGENHTHRTMVAGAAMQPFGPYHFSVPLGPDVWGIDMTVFTWKGSRYAVWSGWEKRHDEFPQNLYIAKMESPVEIGHRVAISRPTFSWETSIAAINEGPQAFVDYGTLYLLYSANASWKQEYATGILELVGDDPLNPRDWIKCPFPLFENVGHGQLLGDRFVYHRKMSTFPGWTDRELAVMSRKNLLDGKFQTFKGN